VKIKLLTQNFGKLSLSILLTMLLVSCVVSERVPRREISNIAGPERVFEQPVGEMFQQLQGAESTGVNGRVGDEMVFWGYRLQDNSDVNLFACAPVNDVDCEARIAAVCPRGGEEIARLTEPGLVRQMNCAAVGVANVGELYPNCTDRETTNALIVGLNTCR